VLNLTPRFEKATGHRLNIGYGLAAELKKRALEGETADVIILTRAMMDKLQKQNKPSGVVRHSKIRTSMSELGHSPPSHPAALTGPQRWPAMPRVFQNQTWLNFASLAENVER
jgi:hypothetical protein